MAWHNDIGKTGEAIAVKHLQDNGYVVLETNWRSGKLEADIIAYKDGFIVFVEVKTRSYSYHGDPQEFVDLKKQKAYISLANTYVQLNRRTEEVRFDIIAIEISTSGCLINHIEDAFSAFSIYNQR